MTLVLCFRSRFKVVVDLRKRTVQVSGGDLCVGETFFSTLLSKVSAHLQLTFLARNECVCLFSFGFGVLGWKSEALRRSLRESAMDRGVQEYYWEEQSSQGRNTEVVYKPYTDSINGERFFQCLICLCVIYFVARLFFDGVVVFLIVGLTVALITQLLAGWSASLRPHHKYSNSHHVF